MTPHIRATPPERLFCCSLQSEERHRPRGHRPLAARVNARPSAAPPIPTVPSRNGTFRGVPGGAPGSGKDRARGLAAPFTALLQPMVGNRGYGPTMSSGPGGGTRDGRERDQKRRDRDRRAATGLGIGMAPTAGSTGGGAFSIQAPAWPSPVPERENAAPPEETPRSSSWDRHEAGDRRSRRKGLGLAAERDQRADARAGVFKIGGVHAASTRRSRLGSRRNAKCDTDTS